MKKFIRNFVKSFLQEIIKELILDVLQNRISILQNLKKNQVSNHYEMLQIKIEILQEIHTILVSALEQ